MIACHKSVVVTMMVDIAYFKALNCIITRRLTANQVVKPKMADMDNLDVSLCEWRSICNPRRHT